MSHKQLPTPINIGTFDHLLNALQTYYRLSDDQLRINKAKAFRLIQIPLHSNTLRTYQEGIKCRLMYL